MIKTEYLIRAPKDAAFKEITIALVSDLHEYRADETLEILREVRPDVIAVPGDLFERYKPGQNLDLYDTSISSRILCAFIHVAERIAGEKNEKKKDTKPEYSYEFLEQASRIAPIVMSFGNHELFLTKEDEEILRRTHTTILDKSFVTIGGVTFGGIPSRMRERVIDKEFLEKFAENKGYKVLLCHHPEYFAEVGQYADLVLAGHCHGGQIRVFGRGLFGPGQGILPKYHHGVYEGKLVVSSGCANTTSLPRWGNPTEVVAVRVKAADAG